MELFLKELEIVWRYLLPALVAMVAAGVICIEPVYRRNSLGIKTAMLLAAGITVFILITQTFKGESITRIIAAVALLIGLVSAGMLLKSTADRNVFTNIGALWLVGVVSVVATQKEYILVGALVLVVMIVQWGIHPLENLLARRHNATTLTVTTKNKDAAEDNVLDILDELQIKTGKIERSREDTTERTVTINITATDKQRTDLSEILVNEKGVLRFSI